MKIENVKDLNSLNRFIYWVNERQNILDKKLNGYGRPLSDDIIFQEYHFTNVRREDDKVSRWLINNLYSRELTEAFSVILIARFINRIEPLELIKDDLKNQNWIEAHSKLKTMEMNKDKIFSSAYLQPEIKGVSRLDKIFFRLFNEVHNRVISTLSIEQAVKDLCEIKYIGEFIGGQMAMDASIFMDGHWLDKKVYAPLGPGSTRGLNRLYERPLTKKWDRWEYDSLLLQLALPLNLRALDIEHSLCEWDKYERILWDQGSYKRFYKS
jgi:hypothetical protein